MKTKNKNSAHDSVQVGKRRGDAGALPNTPAQNAEAIKRIVRRAPDRRGKTGGAFVLGGDRRDLGYAKLGGVSNRPAFNQLTPPDPAAWREREEVPVAAGQLAIGGAK